MVTNSYNWSFHVDFQRMVSNAGDFGELQLAAPDLQREPNEGFCGTKKWFKTYFGWNTFLVSLLSELWRAAGSEWLLLDWRDVGSRQAHDGMLAGSRSGGHEKGCSSSGIQKAEALVGCSEASLPKLLLGTCCVSVRGYVLCLAKKSWFHAVWHVVLQVVPQERFSNWMVLEKRNWLL